MSSEMNEVTMNPDQLREVWSSAQEAREYIQQWAKTNGGFSVYTVRSNMSSEKRYNRLGCRHSGVPRNQKEQEVIDTKAIFIADDHCNVTAATQAKKQRAKDSQRFGCPFEVMIRPLNKDSCQWHVVAMQNKHDYAFAWIRHPTRYIAVWSGSPGECITVVSEDISNLRQKVFNNDPDHGMLRLVQALEADGYRVRYSIRQEGDKCFLRSLL